MNHLSLKQFGHPDAVSVRINTSQRIIKEHKNRLEGGDFIEPTIEAWEEEHVDDVEVDAQEREPLPIMMGDNDNEAIETERDDSERVSIVSEGVGLETIEDGVFIISGDSVRQYALAYPGGYMAFERDFQTKWVNSIQDSPYQEGVKKNAKNKMDVFTQFSHVSVSEFGAVARLSSMELEEYLAEHHMDAEDFENWRIAMEVWEHSDRLAFDEETHVGDVARGAFAATLEADKQEMAG